ncbi:MAG: leucine-rich repeat protein [Paludibacteraceae bacterium]|nr:leucine-rich repeat protein [Paludibacteraceae bacterium]
MKNICRINTLLLFLFLFCYGGMAANYLCFTAEEANSGVWYVNGVGNKPNVQYSLNGVDWTDWSADTPVTLANIGDKVYVRGDNPDGFSHDNSSNDANGPGTTNSRFKMSGRIAASGSVMSLIDGVGTSTKIPCAYCFSDLFRDCVSLTKAPELPATELAPNCYALMFQKCTNLTNAPELPATELAARCYISMFLNCSSLTDVPASLPATKMETGSCWGMFAYCSKLIKSPELSATELAPRCYNSMFIGCESLAEAPKLVATELADSCYYKMFSGCTSLVKAPELPADSWKKGCYSEMFSGCTSLNYIKVNVLTLDNDLDATKKWVDGIDGEGVFIFLCGSKYDKHGVSEVPTNFTIVSSPIVVFQNSDGEELYRDTIGCDVMPEYKGEPPTNGEGQVFKGWNPELTIHETPDIYYYTAVYDDVTSVEGKWLCFTAEEAGSTISYRNVGNDPDVQYSSDGTTWLPLKEGETIRLEKENDKVYIKGVNPNGFSKNANSYTRFVMTGTIAASGSVMSLIDGEGLVSKIPSTCCFLDLFLYCNSLTKAPELTATVLNDSCYWSMFDNCTNLKEAPILPVTDLTPYCYAKMFYKCTSITTAPELPATAITEGCYRNMFYQCTNLTEAPELPATRLAKKCYAHMFGLCENLEKAPELLADELKEECYTGMFEKCSKVNYIKVGVMTLDNNFDATKDWVAGIDGKGVFVFPCGSKYDKHGVSEVPENFTIISSPIVVFQNPDGEELYRDTIGCDVLPEYKGETPTYGEGLVFKDWDPALTIHDTPGTYYYTAVYEEKPVAKNNWLCFTAEEAGSTVGLYNVNNEPDIHYSLDSGQTWVPWAETDVVTLKNVGDKVYVKGVNPDGFSHTIGLVALLQSNPSSVHNTSFRLTGRIAASGSLMSLIDGVGEAKEIPCEHCFSYLFSNQTALVSAPELTATTMKRYCYVSMFRSCSNLIQAPELPATQLALGCYSGMFIFCDGLTKASALPATQLTSQCYNCMFYGCSSLTEVPDLPATTLRDSCYIKMFGECTSLTKAPELLATTWAKDCYLEMFKGCTSLNYIKVNVLTLDNNFNATKNWVDGIDGDGVFVFPCGSKYDKHGISEVPENFTIISSPIVVFQNPDGEELYRDTIGCDVMPEYKGEPPTYGEGQVFKGWDPELTIHETPDTYYYTAVYDETTPEVGDWLCFTAEKEKSTVKFYNIGNNRVNVEFSIDGGRTWNTLNSGVDVMLENIGDKVYIRGNNPNGFSSSESEYSVFDLTGSVAASGSVMSLIDQKGETTEIPNEYCFCRLFLGESSLVQAPEVPATKLKGHCYESMFYNCTNLVKAPKIIPATTLEESCCESMFGLCENLLDAPELPATTLAENCYNNMFYYCSSLEKAPELPALALEKSCYNGMFGACESLIQAPELPATTLAESCYRGMFYNCWNLSETPKLPATKLAKSCYEEMFLKCLSLDEISELPATELAPSCYERMFSNCGSIEETPILPATTLASRCYAYMFEKTSLSEFPKLPATELVDYCYAGMFKDGVASMKSSVELPATELVQGCYEEMFENFRSLDTIKVGVLSLDNIFDATTNWVDGINNEGTFIFPCGSKYDKHGASEVPENFTIISSPIVVFQNPDGEELYRDTIGCDVLPEYKGDTPTYGEGQVFKGWEPELTAHDTPDTYYYMAVYDETTPEVGNWLCFTADEANSVVQYLNVGSNNPNVMYSIDGGKTWEALQESVEVKLEKIGDKVYLKGNNPTGFSQGKIDYTHIKTTGRVFVSGSVMSLIDEEGVSTEIPNDYCFYHLFADSPALIKAPELPATELKKSCYEGMFQECTSLESVPVLPATTLADRCYKNMFLSCHMIKETPELPATTLAKECYSHMFSSCKEVKKAPLLPATVMADSCYSGMFIGCYGLSVAPTLPAVHLAKGCYNGMFEGCWNLEEAPALPATELAVSCYEEMFKGCGSLTKAPVLPATVMKDYCYASMFSDCISLLEAPELPATILADACYEEMFIGCEKLTEAPELPATSLVRECYMDMFASCINITYIKVGVLSLDNFFEATTNWVEGIDNEGTFIFPCGSKYDKHGVSEVPENFKIISSPIVVFQNPDGEELYRDTIGCDVLPVYKGETPTYGEDQVFKGWEPELTIHEIPDTYYYTAVYEEQMPISDVSKCLCFTAEEAGTEIWYSIWSQDNPDLQYSVDEGRTWQTQRLSDYKKVVLENVGDKIYFRGFNPDGLPGKFCFQTDGTIKASGSVMSLIDGIGVTKTIPNKGCFANLFSNCNGLIQAPELPATTLTDSCYSSMFHNCDRLTVAPELPATELAKKCYLHMFDACDKLTEAPKLPAMELADNCYSYMFRGCTSLTKAPELPATKLADACYSYMFQKCTNLIQAPELPATVMKDFCYDGMFYGCESLTVAPELPATELAYVCYINMFNECTNLIQAPELPATELKSGCYYSMFEKCKSLEKAPELPATELVGKCYYNMFRECSNLNYIKVGVMSLDTSTNNWVNGVNKEGVFIFPCGSKYDKHGVSEVPEKFKIISSPVVVFQNPDGEELYRDTIACDVVAEYKGETPTYRGGYVFKGWDKELTVHPEPDTFYYTAVYEEPVSITDISKCLCFTAEEAGSEVWYENNLDNVPDVQYSVDGGRTWNPLAPLEHVVLNSVGDKVYVRGYNSFGFSHEQDYTMIDVLIPGNYSFFGMTGTIAASGSVMSLIDGVGETTVIPNENCFYKLFENCSSLIQAPELPATDLKESCYEHMFSKCTSLSKAPELPAITLAKNCYDGMFASCANLTIAPQLPATSLADGCYSHMFEGCSSLVAAPELPATELAEACYFMMFTACTSLTEAPKLMATSLANECYTRMFYECTSLIKAPELPATTLAYKCYAGMFSECSSLMEAPELPATTLVKDCYDDMFYGCTSLTTAPELPATELVEGCYNGMFEECSSLNYIKVGVMTLDTDFEISATRNWVSGVDGPGIFIFPCGSTYDKHGVSEVPNNFEILRGPVTVIFQNPDSTVLWKDTINCDEVPEYKGETPSMGDGYFFIGWDKDLTVVGDVSVYYITAMYEDLSNYATLHLTVDDELYLVLPGGSENIGYELLEGGGSRYEIWYDGAIITDGAVPNDSIVLLNCPAELAPGSYVATLVMYDENDGRASCDFEFNVMLPDNKENSYYVKVWNDVVICRNGDGIFQSYMWYKDRKKQENGSHQYYNDITLLNGEYMVYVCDIYGKCYFIEPTSFQIEEAVYSVSAHPNIVDRGTNFIISVSGVDESHLKDARIVIYRSDGVVARIIDEVEMENEMHLGLGEYVIVLTVSDGKNANCKVLVK